MRVPSAHSRSTNNRDNEVMTPMIDVVFLLLIFFVVAAAGQVPELVLPTEMTSAGSVESEVPVEQDPWIVEVWIALRSQEAGHTVIDMNGRQFSDVDDLREPLSTLAALTPENPVILDIGPQVPMRDMIAVYDLCRGVGFESVNLAAEAKEVAR